MKKIRKQNVKFKNKIALFILIFATLILTGCSKEVIDTSKLNVVTSFYPMYIATANIIDGVEDVEIKNLTTATTGCLHDYQLTTANMVTLSTADVFVVNGGGMESFLEKVAEQYENLKIIDATNNILEEHYKHSESEENAESVQIQDHTENVENEHDEHNHGENAHVWVSISLYIKEVENIRDSLIKIDSKNAEAYEKNANEYIQELNDLKDKMHETLDEFENKKIVTFHEAFEYFAEEFELEIVSVIEREPGTYPSAGEVAKIIDKVREEDVCAIFVEPQYSRSAADTIARETKVPVYTLDPVVTGELTKEAYIEIMEKNLETLKEAFEKNKN